MAYYIRCVAHKRILPNPTCDLISYNYTGESNTGTWQRSTHTREKF